jgi:predicted SAM-dependent methyltransferase
VDLLLRIFGSRVWGTRERGPEAPTASGSRRGPSETDGIKRVHVGCGPHNLLETWWNVDVRHFPGVDEVMDATKPWPWIDLDYVYGEHFLEHLGLDEAIHFLEYAGSSLRVGGSIRLSTPNLEWVLKTHFARAFSDERTRILATLRMNRAFHGWGHRFLYSEDMLRFVIMAMSFDSVRFCAYGESDDPELSGLERHGNYFVADTTPSVVIVEARRGEAQIGPSPELTELAEDEFLRYVRSGH